jgi:hypothetical protein
MLAAVNPNDARLQPGCYLTDGTRLMEVTRAEPGTIYLLNSLTEVRSQIKPWEIVHSWRLVQLAPASPDTP